MIRLIFLGKLLNDDILNVVAYDNTSQRNSDLFVVLVSNYKLNCKMDSAQPQKLIMHSFHDTNTRMHAPSDMGL